MESKCFLCVEAAAPGVSCPGAGCPVVACSQQHLALHLQPASPYPPPPTPPPPPPPHLQTQAASHLPPSCLPYTISFQKGVGRCLVMRTFEIQLPGNENTLDLCIDRHFNLQVASRTVLPGELVLAESPIVVGPNQVGFSFLEIFPLLVYPVLTQPGGDIFSFFESLIY